MRACKRAIIFSHSWFFGSFLFGQIAGDFSNSNDIFEKTYQALEILHAFRSKSAFFCVQHSQAGAKPVLRADFFLPTTDLGLRVKPQLRRNISFSIAWKEIVVVRWLRRADILFQKHDSRIIRQSSNTVTGWEMIRLLIFLLAAGCWLWGYTQLLQRFSSHLVMSFRVITYNYYIFLKT